VSFLAKKRTRADNRDPDEARKFPDEGRNQRLRSQPREDYHRGHPGANVIKLSSVIHGFK
jgi:hypothetical protein